MLSPLDKLTLYSYNILSSLAAQILPHFTPSGQVTTSLLHNFTPLAAQLLGNVTPSGQINPLLLHFTPLGTPTLTSLKPL